MSAVQSVERSGGKDFALESVVPGEVPGRVIEELRRLRTTQNEATADFREAVKVQADKHKVKPKALRRYVNALAADKVDEAQVECEQVVHLIERAKA